ncbi:MAG: Dihydrolipoyllysine-residue succinyltransferase component of 2-oxoglutarate dehydrogenase complex [Alphaproteobacteria bacterium MarineAlpha9_Bin3]|nr:MAG: Dihydrolipoyllysine-residue succinyltransferase component of 2-oxoglutarate dehydrogenase complex [Alphaproteobacteria bacterium MarineAlpha9_Bin3]|tara:strand:+ start:41134 stop:42492 length:1359 start_codon:yes stop_codon:yes gene_type:complete
MATAILMPSLSPTMTEGNLAKWCKNVGDKVKSGDVIAEVETDKATMEIEAVDEGILDKVLFDDGAEGISVNSVIAVLRDKNDSDSDINELLEKYNVNNDEKQTSDNKEKIIEVENVNNEINNITDKSDNENNNPIENIVVNDDKEINNDKNIEVVSSEIDSSYSITENTDRIAVSPLAKRIAIQNKVDLKLITGTGPRGRIIKNDIANFINNNNSLNNFSNINIKSDVRKKTSSMRKVIAERLSKSKKEVPHFYLSIDCNVDELLKGRAFINKSLSPENKISINDFIIKALAMSLSIVPEANCSWNDDEIIHFGSIDISVAVAVDGGLFTPVIKNADYLKLSDISKNMKDFISRANSGKLLPGEYEGGNFSISNLGMYDIDNFSAIINPPQSGILAIGSISKRPLVINDNIKIANIMTCQLSGDHRVIDGAVGAKLLKEFKDIIENPIKMIV